MALLRKGRPAPDISRGVLVQNELVRSIVDQSSQIPG